jgi:ABC-type multidrug transport system fused ATPase/permease subunit
MILLMEDGQIVERGTHDELMAARAGYYEMVVRQMEAASHSDEEMVRV